MSALTAPPADELAVEGEVLLSIKEVSLRLGEVQVLEKMSCEIRNRRRPNLTTGQVVGLLGPSGVGKTRLLRIIAGLDTADGGEVRGLKGKVIKQGSVGVVFQNYPLLRHRTVASNLEIAGAAMGLSSAAAKLRRRELLERFGLADRGRFYPAQLSGGQRQRIAIAQQLMVPKHLLLMDEPFSGLDPVALVHLLKLINEVAHMDDLNTVVLVTHDTTSALIASDTLFLLGRARNEKGHLVGGANIQATYDLVERGLAWQPDIEAHPEFGALEREIRVRFKEL